MTYNITYNLDGGKDPGNPTTYNITTNTITLKNPTKTGYTFNGWKEGSTITKGSTGNKTFTAQWKINAYDVTFNGNGNTGGTVPAKITANYNTKPTLPTGVPTKTGYTFAGWKDSAGTLHQAGKATYTVPAQNSTLTAQWTANAQTITYKANGGTGSDVVQNTTYNAKPTIKANPFTRTGYTFAGWATSATGAVSDVYPANKATTKAITGNVTLYAVWTPVKYAITYNLDGGSHSGNPATYTIEDAITLKAPTKTGYTGSWKEGSSIIKGSTGDKTFNAKWTANKYTVTFNDGLGETLSTQSVEYGKSATSPVPPIREGYTFAGWDKAYDNISSNITITAKWTHNPTYAVTFTDGIGNTINSQVVEKGKSAISPTNPTRKGYIFAGWDKIFTNIIANTTINAKWEIATYKVTFVDGQGEILSTQTVDYGKEATSPTTPTREGFTFTGWDKEFNNITADTTITAKWSKNTSVYTVLFVDGFGNVISTQSIEEGRSANTPQAPIRDGYTFIGWDKKYDNITENITITAKWTENKTYNVIFTDGQGNILSTQKVEKGKSAIIPSNPVKNGYTFNGWDKEVDNITSDITINAKWLVNQYEVTFTDGKGNILSTQKIEHGKNAIIPKNPESKGQEFIGWDKTNINITENTIITAQWKSLIDNGWYYIQTSSSPLFRLGTRGTKEEVKVERGTNSAAQKFQITRLNDGN